jgi:hypothetical protein
MRVTELIFLGAASLAAVSAAPAPAPNPAPEDYGSEFTWRYPIEMEAYNA